MGCTKNQLLSGGFAVLLACRQLIMYNATSNKPSENLTEKLRCLVVLDVTPRLLRSGIFLRGLSVSVVTVSLTVPMHHPFLSQWTATQAPFILSAMPPLNSKSSSTETPG